MTWLRWLRELWSGWGSIKLWEMRNLTLVIWEVRIVKDQGRVSTGLVCGKRREGAVWFSVSGAPLDHCAKGGYVDVLFMCGECGFCSLGILSYSKEWVKLGTKGMYHCSKEVKCQQGDTLHTLGLNCSRIAAHSVCLRPNG